MKHLVFLSGFVAAVCLLMPIWVFAQAESFDILQYNAPPGWTKTQNDTSIVLSSVDKEAGSFCILTVHSSEQSAGNVARIFADQWTKHIVKPIGPAAVPATENSSADGWTTTAGAAKVNVEEGEVFVFLTVIDGFGRSVSITAVFNHESYLPPIDTFINSVRPRDPASAPAPSPSEGNKLTGKWAKSTSGTHGMSQSGNVLNSAYYKSQYDFRQDGSYLFKAEQWFGYIKSDEYRTTDESGTYSIKGDVLTVMPLKSSTTVRNREGRVLSQQRNALEKVAYRWVLHYFSGIDEMNLVLRPAKETTRDAIFASSDLFPNSYLFSQKYQPEWKFD